MDKTDKERIDQLEKEVRAVKKILEKLQSKGSGSDLPGHPENG